MNDVMRTQFIELGVMFSCGVTLAAIRWVLLLCRKQDHPGKYLTMIQELLFWCLAGLLTAAYLYDCSYGEWSVHAFAALLLGAGVGYGILSMEYGRQNKEKS